MSVTGTEVCGKYENKIKKNIQFQSYVPKSIQLTVLMAGKGKQKLRALLYNQCSG